MMVYTIYLGNFLENIQVNDMSEAIKYIFKSDFMNLSVSVIYFLGSGCLYARDAVCCGHL